MLEKPAIPDKDLMSCLKNEYKLRVAEIAFLPLGADMNTAVYRAVSNDGTAYFVKLRKGDLNEACVAVPKYLSGTGFRQIIPSFNTRAGRLWAELKDFKVILYPFIEGRNGFEVNLTDQQRVEFGTALKRFHSSHIPPELTDGIVRETFSPYWRDVVVDFLDRIEIEIFEDPVAVKMATFLKTRRAETLALVRKTESLADVLQADRPEFVLCHADIHAWNLLIDATGALYMVDWDTLIFAPKERDLMFVGSGLGGGGHTLQEEESLFQQGYGPTQVDPTGMAYYRYERIIEDIASYCQQIFLSDEGGQDREQALEYLSSNYLPNGTIEIASRADQT
jgi:spectinomycin phosphotransferase